MVKYFSNILTKSLINNSVSKNPTDVLFPFRNVVSGILYYIPFFSGYFHTFQSKKCFIFCLLLLVAGVGSVNGATKTWTPTTGGAWTTGGNWNPSAPVAGDDVVINSDQSANITAVPTISLNSLTVSGTCSLVSSSGSKTMTIG